MTVRGGGGQHLFQYNHGRHLHTSACFELAIVLVMGLSVNKELYHLCLYARLRIVDGNSIRSD
jgi:hypothetical protein